MSDCAKCFPDIACVHQGQQVGGVNDCPWYNPVKPGLPKPSTMLLRITGAEDTTWMELRLVCTFTEERGTLYENWSSPDAPLPQPIISELLTFLERHVCSPVSRDKAITRATVPASLIARLMGPAWMTRFRQIINESVAVKALDKLANDQVSSPPECEAIFQENMQDLLADGGAVHGPIMEAEVVPPESLGCTGPSGRM